MKVVRARTAAPAANVSASTSVSVCRDPQASTVRQVRQVLEQ